MIARFALTMFCVACSPLIVSTRADDAGPREIEKQRNVEYGSGSGEKLTLHLAKPKLLEKPAPAVVVIHGGGWAAGSKDAHQDLIEQLARRGYVAVSVGYRLAPKYKFPAQVEDVKCCVRWLRAHADELQLQSDRIGAVGFSAGAHLSMMLGVMDPEDGLEGDGGWADQSSKVQAVVAYFGPTNLVDPFPPVSRVILEDWIGKKPEAAIKTYQRASPITYVNRHDADMLLFQGTNDPLVPYDQAWQMVRALTKNDIRGRVEFLLGAEHGWGKEENERTWKSAQAFLDERLTGK
ncbi:MAG: alpha/beta hydrolase [Pirellulales bacterium]|nr:alpha/beta hydrolase [Pirellulales bacterium]